MIRSLVLAVLVLLSARSEADTPPWIDVPVVMGAAGQYTCITRPTGQPLPIAVITCDPYKFNSYPPFAQEFLIDHEHGHVYQIAYNPAMLFSQQAEYDADCYGAVIMAARNVAGLTQTIHWLETVVGYQGGDATHGNGFQMAARLRQCAASAGAVIAAGDQRIDGVLVADAGGNTPIPTKATSPTPRAPISGGDAKPDFKSFVSHGPGPLPERDAPYFCTAVEILVDSTHTWFWESSSSTSEIRPELSRAIGGKCEVAVGRDKVVCTIAAENAEFASKKLGECFHASDWVRNCESKKCARITYAHHSKATDHESVVIDRSRPETTLTFVAPARKAHNHRKALAQSAAPK